MSDPGGLWQPLDLIVDLFTKEGRRQFGGFLLLFASAAAAFVIAVYLITGDGPLWVLSLEAK